MNKATLDVYGRKIELVLSEGEGSIRISAGDMVVLVGRVGDPVRSYIYYNETTGSGTLESARRASRLALTFGWMGVVVGLAILMTAALAARREPASFSTVGIFHFVIYMVSMVGSGAMVVFSLAMLSGAMYTRKMLALVRSVASGSGTIAM